MRSDERDSLDRLLDDALASYSAQDPRPELEQRVRSRIEAERAPSRFFLRRRPVLAAVAAAALLVAAVALRVRPTPAPAPPEPVRAAVAPPPGPLSVEPRPPAVAKRKPVTKPVPLPKQQLFPAPAPMTSEERALLAFIRIAPEAALRPEEPQRASEPIRIEQIEIRPLETDATQ